METGYRTGPDGKLVPRDIIHRFLCTYKGEEVFSADLSPAISANPFLSFTHGRERQRRPDLPLDRRQGRRAGRDGLAGRGRLMANAVRSAFLAAAGLLAAVGATLPSLPQQAADPRRRSGFDFMSPQTQAMQRDDTANPGMLWALEGEALWSAPAGDAGRSCAACHGEPASMTGVSARYPALERGGGRPVDLQTRINLCRVDRQNARALPL